MLIKMFNEYPKIIANQAKIGYNTRKIKTN